MRQFIPIPYAALDCARSPTERLVVLYLYETAHARRWMPFGRSVRQIERETGCSFGSIRRVLKRLEEEELMVREIEATGGRKEGTRLRFFDPSGGQNGLAHGLAHGLTHGRLTGIEEGAEQSTPSDSRLAHQLAHGAAHLSSSEPEPEDSEKRRSSESPAPPAARQQPSGDGLSKAARRSLRGAGLADRAALSTRTRSQLLLLDGIGPKTVDRIEALLADAGLALQPEPTPTTTRGKLQHRLIGAWCEAWAVATGGSGYPIDKHRDLGHALRWAGMLKIGTTSSPEQIDAAVQRFGAVAQRYCADAAAGRVKFPSGPPTTQKLSTILADRLQQEDTSAAALDLTDPAQFQAALLEMQRIKAAKEANDNGVYISDDVIDGGAL